MLLTATAQLVIATATQTMAMQDAMWCHNKAMPNVDSSKDAQAVVVLADMDTVVPMIVFCAEQDKVATGWSWDAVDEVTPGMSYV